MIIGKNDIKDLKENIINDIEKIKERLAMKYMAGTLKTQDIDCLPIDNGLRTLICSFDPCYACHYAEEVDKKPTDETRTGACKNSIWAYYYARDVDRKPTDETRTAACKNSFRAYLYARRIDEKPTKETKIAACKDPWPAYEYARYVDKKPTEETRTAACESSYYKTQYENFEREYSEQHRKD